MLHINSLQGVAQWPDTASVFILDYFPGTVRSSHSDLSPDTRQGGRGGGGLYLHAESESDLTREDSEVGCCNISTAVRKVIMTAVPVSGLGWAEHRIYEAHWSSLGASWRCQASSQGNIALALN